MTESSPGVEEVTAPVTPLESRTVILGGQCVNCCTITAALGCLIGAVIAVAGAAVLSLGDSVDSGDKSIASAAIGAGLGVSLICGGSLLLLYYRATQRHRHLIAQRGVQGVALPQPAADILHQHTDSTTVIVVWGQPVLSPSSSLPSHMGPRLPY